VGIKKPRERGGQAETIGEKLYEVIVGQATCEGTYTQRKGEKEGGARRRKKPAADQHYR